MKLINNALHKGFTLIELLIVVVILGVLAAIAIPQFTTSTDDARSAALDSTLATMRTTIDMYYQEHGEYPAALGDGTNLANTTGAFTSQLTKFTDPDGDEAATKDATHIHGPYLKKGVPADPITGSNAVAVVSAGALGLAGTGSTGGWKYDSVTGEIIMNHTGLDPNGTGYDKH